MRNVNADPPPSADRLHEQIRIVLDVLKTTGEHRHEPLRQALRALHEAVITHALVNAGINDWWTMRRDATMRDTETIHVPYGDPPKGTVYLSDKDGASPDGTRGYIVGLADLYDGTGEECNLTLTSPPITDLARAVRVFIDTINNHRGQAT